MFSKSLVSALSAMAYLAERSAGGDAAATADQIARERQLNRPFVAKLLTALAGAGLVVSKPGRHGGFALARPAAEISLLEIARCVGYRSKITCCPFGPQYGDDKGLRCPLHDQICELRDQVDRFLETSTLAGFADARRD